MDFTQFNNLEIHGTYGFGLHNNLLSEVSFPRTIQPEYFHKEVTPTTTITNQKSSGRCWLFAGLNMLRRDVISDLKLSNNFEFSQSYLFFWDKIERMNYLIDTINELKSQNKDLNDRVVNHLMKDPFGDGGQWNMFENLVNKYGLVPQSVYPESIHSSNSRGINMVLCQIFRDYIAKLYQGIELSKEYFLNKTYLLLVRFFGKPPNKFDFEYKKDKQIITKEFTSLGFKDFCKINLDKYVSIVHDPRNNYNKLYTIELLNNIINGNQVKYLNLPMENIQELVKTSLNDNNPVWFGSDVGQFFHRKTDMLDEEVFSYQKYLNLELSLTKKDRMETGESIPSHAMVFSGYHQDKFGNIDYWKIENSWGKKGKYEGHLVCSNKWFQDFTYQVVIDKKYLKDNEKQVWDTNDFSKILPLWDPLGTLA